MTRRFGLIAVGVLALTAATLPVAHAAPLLSPVCNQATDWPVFGHDNARSFATEDNCITRGNAAALRPKWFFNANAPITAQPVVVAGVVYAGTYDGRFFAVRASNGKAVWAKPFDATAYDTSNVDYGVVPSSAAVTKVDGRRVVVFSGGATVFVLDAASGRLLGHQCLDRVDTTCHGKSGYTTEIEASPAIVAAPDGHSVRIIVGTDVNEQSPSGPVGVVSLRFDGHNLTPEWWFDPEAGQTYAGLAPTQRAGHETQHGCGDVWASPTVDTSVKTVVIATGNCRHPERVRRAPGVSTPSLVESVIALDLTTGAFRWQHAPRTAAEAAALDFDFGATPNVLRPGVIGEGGKDGFYYVIDGRTGKPQWRVRVCNGSEVGGMIGSAALGAFSNGHPAVFVACRDSGEHWQPVRQRSERGG